MNVKLSHENLTETMKFSVAIIDKSTPLHISVMNYADVFAYDGLILTAFINNLKDALFHFKKMNSAYLLVDPNSDTIDESQLIVFAQSELLSEHITRGVIDMFVEMLQNAALFWDTLLDCFEIEYKISDKRKCWDGAVKLTRTALHFCRNKVLDWRNGKMHLFRIAFLNANEIDALKSLTQTINQHYMDILNSSDEPNVFDLFEKIAIAYEKGYGLNRIGSVRNINAVADELGVDATRLRSLNGLTDDKECFPENSTWIYC